MHTFPIALTGNYAAANSLGRAKLLCVNTVFARDVAISSFTNGITNQALYEVHCATGISPFVVVPTDYFNEITHRHRGQGVKYAGMRIVNDIT